MKLNRLDAYRIQALFALEQIPPETADKTALAHWWLGHAGWWLALVCAAWSALLLLAASRHLERSEI